MVPVPPVPFLIRGIFSFEFVQNPGRQWFIYKLFYKLPNDTRPFMATFSIIPLAQPIYLPKELIRKSLGPWQKLFGNIGL